MCALGRRPAALLFVRRQSGAARLALQRCGLGPQAAVDYGTAHGALAMTTPGDNAMTSLAEVRALVEGGSAAAVR